MPNITRWIAIAALLASSMPALAQWLTLATPDVPRTADGAPDLSAPAPRTPGGHIDLTGLWIPVKVSGNLLDPANVHEWARSLMTEREARYFQDDPRFRCLPSGPGFLTLSGANFGMRRIVQHPSVIAILNADLKYRQIFMDGRQLEPDPHPIWTGYSVGRWDGDTLVVESNGYNDKTWLTARGLPHTERLRITERYLRTDFGHIRLDASYEDPDAFESPLRATIEFRLAADEEMLELVCNEASEGQSHWGGNITQADVRVVEVSPETLARYVGTYEGYWLNSWTRVDITLENGELFLLRTPPYARNANVSAEKSRLVALSDTAFECLCGLGFIFTAVDGEMATEVAEVHVSGAWPFSRVP